MINRMTILKNLKISQELEKNTCDGVLFIVKLQTWACNFTIKKTLLQVLSCESCQMFYKSLFREYLWVAGSTR